MRLIERKNQYRRDFQGIYECEACGNTTESRGYDDTYFHSVVIPAMTCPTCGEKAPADYIPTTPIIPEGVTL